MQASFLVAFLFVFQISAQYQFLKIIDIEEFLRLRGPTDRWLVPDDVLPSRKTPDSLAETQKQLKDIANRELPVLRLCPYVSLLVHECPAPKIDPYPLFPITEAYRNLLLGRPHPDVVRANVELATSGRLSSVAEVVTEAAANLDNLDELSDDVLALLASNFHRGKAGWVSGLVCEAVDFGGLAEDLLVAEEEQRALAASFLYVNVDPGYRSRRKKEMREFIRQLTPEKQEEMQMDRLDAAVREMEEKRAAAARQFMERVAQLERDPEIAKQEWHTRYDGYLTAFKQAQYESLGVQTAEELPKDVAARVNHYTTRVEQEADRIMFTNVMSMQDFGFVRFLPDYITSSGASSKPLRMGAENRLAYNRWKSLSAEEQARYIPA